jgi:mannose-6-phosphate isomerase-like protein (cupin superfamily)
MSMRVALVLPLSIAAAFGAGLAVSPWSHDVLPQAHAQAVAATAVLAPAVIDVLAIRDADLNGAPNADIRSKPYVVTDNATVSVQMGNVGKHNHAKSDEIQYIVEGSGTMWFGDKKIDIRPGMLVVIPKGTNHGGTEATTGRFKAIAIKVPPQVTGDTNFVP